MDLDKDDNRTLRSGLLSDFKEQNSTNGIDFTAMKATWLSRRHPEKRVGSLVIWLKHLAAAEHLLQAGTTLFGASGAFCNRFEEPTGLDLCYNCNKYGHKQTSCKSKTKCGVCSDPHNTRNCSQRSSPKCPACGGGHTVFDKGCSLHPRHGSNTNRGERQRENARTPQGSSDRQGCDSRSKGISSAQRAPSPIFGPELPPHMQRERQRSVEVVNTAMMDTEA
jgi:hypothetical protein